MLERLKQLARQKRRRRSRSDLDATAHRRSHLQRHLLRCKIRQDFQQDRAAFGVVGVAELLGATFLSLTAILVTLLTSGGELTYLALWAVSVAPMSASHSLRTFSE
jgi:hypothetical protein